MPPLPVISSLQAIRAFERAGWIVRRRKGSHITRTKEGSINVLTVVEK